MTVRSDHGHRRLHQIFNIATLCLLLSGRVNDTVTEPFDTLVLFKLGMKGYSCTHKNVLFIILRLWKF
jgi:hypothetical protein